MPSNNPEHRGSDRRRFLATVGALGATSLAGCSIQMPNGENDADSGDDATSTPTQTPTTTVTSTSEPTETQTTTRSTSEPVQTPTTTVHTSNGIEIEVIPASRDSKSTGTRSLGSQQTERGDDMVCTTEQEEATVDGGGLHTENLVLSHRLNELWPGAIIPAMSVATGGFGPALSPTRLPNRQPPEVRSPITLAVYIDANRFANGGNSDPVVSKVVDPPTSAEVEQARVDLLSEVQEGTSSILANFDIKQVHSENHLDLHFGVDYSNLAMDIGGEFDFSRSTSMNNILVRFFQVYYLMGVTFPNPHGSFVTDQSVVERNDLLISDVAFGRLLLFSAKSKHSAEDMRLGLNAGFRGAGSQASEQASDEGDISFAGPFEQGSVELGVRERRVFEETELRGQAIGGGAADALQLISGNADEMMSQLADYLLAGANYGPDSPGAPIGFTARYLNTQDRANTYLTTEYNARNCYPKTREFRIDNVTLTAESTYAGSLQVYGDIYIWPSHPDNETDEDLQSVWPRDRDQILEVPEGETKPLVDIDKATVEFEIPEDQTWSEYMEDASIRIKADLKERDDGWFNPDDWQDLPDNEKTEEWDVTSSVGQTPTVVLTQHGDTAHLKFDISPVPLQ